MTKSVRLELEWKMKVLQGKTEGQFFCPNAVEL